ncbi:MAG: hypothetical protein GEV11_06015 [Streptosporangiales bacterium]|nr:hypothetical protein [Streptosporangiales bacterium]
MPEDVLASPPRRPLGRAGKVVLALLGTAVAAGLVFASLGDGGGPGPLPATPTATPSGAVTPVAGPVRTLAGAPAAGPTGLRVLIPADPPVVIDLDVGTRHPVRGIPSDGDRINSVTSLGPNEAIVSSDRPCDDCSPDAELYLVGGADHEARRIGTGRSAVPDRDGRSVWVIRDGARDRCRLDRITVHGGEPDRHELATLDCGIRLVRDTERGLVLDGPSDGASDAMLLDHDGTSRAELRGPVAYADNAWVQFDMFGRRVLLRGGMIEWHWPSALEAPGELVPDYGDRYVFAEFAAPQEVPVPGGEHVQRLDLWVLDTVDPRWIRTPRMPLAVHLKATSAAWTVDNRLVMVGSFPQVGEAAAIWTRGARDWKVRRVDLPAHPASDTFALLEPPF